MLTTLGKSQVPLSENDLVVLTSRLLECDELSIQEKILFSKVSMFKKFGCFATNEYFGRILGVSTKRAGVVICSLVDKGYLDRKTLTVDNMTKRSLAITSEKQDLMYNIPHPEKIPPPYKEGITHPENRVTPHPESRVHNKDNINKDNNKYIDDDNLNGIKEKEKGSEGQVSVSGSFQKLWDKYPQHRRGNKKNLLVRYRKIVNSDPNMIDKLDRSLDEWLNSEAWSGGFIYNINKWFKEEIYLIQPLAKKENDPWRQIDGK